MGHTYGELDFFNLKSNHGILSLVDCVSRALEIEIRSSVCRASVPSIISEPVAQKSFKYWLLDVLGHISLYVCIFLRKRGTFSFCIFPFSSTWHNVRMKISKRYSSYFSKNTISKNADSSSNDSRKFQTSLELPA